MPFAILPFTDVFVAVGPGIGALSVLFVIPVSTDVFVASLGTGKGALSALFAILPCTGVALTGRPWCRDLSVLFVISSSTVDFAVSHYHVYVSLLLSITRIRLSSTSLL